MLEKVKRFFSKLKEDRLSESSAECAYYMILSLVPFIIFFITLIQFTIIDKAFILELAEKVIPKSMIEFVSGIIDEVYSKSIGTVSISLVFALWSASKGFYALCKGFRNIYKVSEEKSNIRIRFEGALYTLVFIICIILVMILFIFGKRIHGFIARKFFHYGIITSALLKFRTIFTIGFLFIAFLILYKFFSKNKMKFKNQIPGAIFSSIAWVLTSYIFSIYIDIFKGFTNMYGSLTSIVLVMMWLYVCIYIILLGAEINTIVREFKFKKIEEKKK